MTMDAKKCFVGGLTRGTSVDTLVEHFTRFGTVKDVVIPTGPEDGVARGFAFITFNQESEANSAKQAPSSEHILDGKQVDVKPCQDRRRMHPGGYFIFIGGLPPETTEEGLRNVFSAYGDVVHIALMQDHNSGRPKGFGFITFASTDACDQLVKEHFVDYLDKKIEIKRAIISRHIQYNPSRMDWTPPSGNRNGGYRYIPRGAGNASGYVGNRGEGSYGGDNPATNQYRRTVNNGNDAFTYRNSVYNTDYQYRLLNVNKGYYPQNQWQQQPPPPTSSYGHHNQVEYSPEMYNSAGYMGYAPFDSNMGMPYVYPLPYQGMEAYKPMMGGDQPQQEYHHQALMTHMNLTAFMPLSPNSLPSQPAVPAMVSPPLSIIHMQGSGVSSGRIGSAGSGSGVAGLYQNGVGPTQFQYNNSSHGNGNNNNHASGGHGAPRKQHHAHRTSPPGRGPGRMTGTGDSVSGVSYK
uniref:Putative nuclear polyadenylated RNA-binding protein 4 n=1 Tax=Hypsibius dujardini TaxID=232323 RepID=A0A0U3BN15_HYPDU|nr:putative nuclear polyadenylated RNA-binding protein 4 [Hypsibius dujardini]